MAQGKLIWRRDSNGQDDLIIFDPGYKYESAQLHLYKKSESISISDAKEEIQQAEHISPKLRNGIDEVSRETISRLFIEARTGGEPTLMWDVDTASRD